LRQLVNPQLHNKMSKTIESVEWGYRLNVSKRPGKRTNYTLERNGVLIVSGANRSEVLNYMRHPKAGQLNRDIQKQGLEVQTWGLGGPSNVCVYAGVHFIPELSPRWLWKLHTHWLRWRKWYDNLPENRNQDYPAKHNPVVRFTGAHPIDDPKAVKWIEVSTAQQ